MKLKRTKLAALAMTALMAVGAMSLAAYAEEADTPAVAATSYTFEDISFASDGTVTLTYKANDGSAPMIETATATVYKTTAADCANDGTTIYSYTTTIDGTAKTYYSEAFVTSTKTGKHTYGDVVVTKEATCTEEGAGYKVCTVCGKEVLVTLDKVQHQTALNSATPYSVIPNTVTAEELTTAYGSTVNALSTVVTNTCDNWNIKVENGKIVLGSDGLPQAAVATEDAYYYMNTYCTVCKETFQEVVKIPATTADYVVVTEVSNVSSLAKGDQFKTNEIPLANNSIVLTDCTKDGYYVVEYYSSNNILISTLKIPVTAHHSEVTTIEFASEADKEQCNVTYKNGTYTVTSKSCYQSVTYYEVTYCKSATCSSTTTGSYFKYVYDTSVNYTALHYLSYETKTAAAAGDHSVSETARTAIANAVANGASYADLYYLVKDNYSSYVKLTNNTSTCETAGTVDVEYTCKVCGKVVETETVKVTAPGHKEDVAVVENLKASTCAENGSYDSVVYCVNKELYGCTKEYSRTSVLLPRTAHTNEESVTAAGVGTEDTNDSLGASDVEVVLVGDVIIDPGVETITAGTVATIKKGVATSTSSVFTDSNGVVYPILEGYGYNKAALASGTKAYSAYAYVVSYCDVCGYEVLISEPYTLTLTVDSVTKEKSDGTAGSITITATYTRTTGTQKTFSTTKTYKYYSSVLAYAARTEVDPLNGLNLDSDGVYRYYVDDAVDYTYSGVVTYNGGQFFVANGVLCSGANGLNLYNGTWYFLANGQVQTQYTGFAEYDGEYFYIVKGVLSTTVNGLVEYDGSQFLVAEGRLISTYNGLYQDFDGVWYFLANGQVQDYTGVTYYNGAFFKLVNGVLDDSFNGTIEYDGATFNVVAGQLYDQVA